MDTTQFPKRMSIKKADRWLAEHPEIQGWDRVQFWNDQSAKHMKSSGKWLIIAGCLLGLSALIQVVSAIVKLVSL
jgi:hypothetical protein